ncbi:lasso RiPP family leader peptide-containing protein [Streptomyces armeniacus]|uniref:Lasso RiPP family leader peptide-containing protein n=1 Tax=Streptomyces armeniacus TaxID=83291 RepID=A0A345Y015_9ACTN|nr:lasso RiPP family leader peptide-containing protein [Streptomyces armeniacus]
MCPLCSSAASRRSGSVRTAGQPASVRCSFTRATTSVSTAGPAYATGAAKAADAAAALPRAPSAPPPAPPPAPLSAPPPCPAASARPHSTVATARAAPSHTEVPRHSTTYSAPLSRSPAPGRTMPVNRGRVPEEPNRKATRQRFRLSSARVNTTVPGFPVHTPFECTTLSKSHPHPAPFTYGVLSVRLSRPPLRNPRHRTPPAHTLVARNRPAGPHIWWPPAPLAPRRAHSNPPCAAHVRRIPPHWCAARATPPPSGVVSGPAATVPAKQQACCDSAQPRKGRAANRETEVIMEKVTTEVYEPPALVGIGEFSEVTLGPNNDLLVDWDGYFLWY